MVNKLEVIQSELRHQRRDHSQILYLLNKLLVNKALQTQVDDFYPQEEEDNQHPEDSRDID